MEAITSLGGVSQGEVLIVDALLLVLADYNISLRENAFIALARISNKNSHIVSQLRYLALS